MNTIIQRINNTVTSYLNNPETRKAWQWVCPQDATEEFQPLAQKNLRYRDQSLNITLEDGSNSICRFIDNTHFNVGRYRCKCIFRIFPEQCPGSADVVFYIAKRDSIMSLKHYLFMNGKFGAIRLGECPVSAQFRISPTFNEHFSMAMGIYADIHDLLK